MMLIQEVFVVETKVSSPTAGPFNKPGTSPTGAGHEQRWAHVVRPSHLILRSAVSIMKGNSILGGFSTNKFLENGNRTRCETWTKPHSSR